jgi:hypothetical protein
MHIAIIGGRDKTQVDLTQIAKAAGYELEFHDGHANGRGAHIIRNIVSRAELVVIVTEINSHSGVFIAKREAQRFKKPTMVTRNFSCARLRGLIDALNRRRDVSSWDQGEPFGQEHALTQPGSAGRNHYVYEPAARVAAGGKGR